MPWSQLYPLNKIFFWTVVPDSDGPGKLTETELDQLFLSWRSQRSLINFPSNQKFPKISQTICSHYRAIVPGSWIFSITMGGLSQGNTKIIFTRKRTWEISLITLNSPICFLRQASWLHVTISLDRRGSGRIHKLVDIWNIFSSLS